MQKLKLQKECRIETYRYIIVSGEIACYKSSPINSEKFSLEVGESITIE